MFRTTTRIILGQSKLFENFLLKDKILSRNILNYEKYKFSVLGTIDLWYVGFFYGK
jgi:hypothetical protein